MPPSVHIILGPPGTGKTTRLLNIMERELERGVEPHRIAFVSFTRRAAQEAASRAKEKFGFEDKDLPHFRTLHSLAFRELGISRSQVFSRKHQEEVGAALGLRFSHAASEEEGGVPSGYYNGDRYAFLDNFSRARVMSPRDTWHQLSEDGLDYWEFQRYLDTMFTYKQDRKLWEFQDMIDKCCQLQIAIDVEVAIIDEAQDLSTSQHAMVQHAFRHAERVYYAGDDDQAIYNWSGADVSRFQNLKGTTEILSQTHRYGAKIHRVAEGVIRRVQRRTPKRYQPLDKDGTVEYHNSFDSLDVRSGGEWQLLGRNIYHLKNFIALAREQGVAYTYRGKPAVNQDHIQAIRAWEAMRKGRQLNTEEMALVIRYLPRGANLAAMVHKIWHEALARIPATDRIYYTSLLRAGESLTRWPRVHINTIHSAKGAEADNVAIMTDLTERTFQGLGVDPDNEARCFYVGVTRAKRALHIIQPQTRKGYQL